MPLVSSFILKPKSLTCLQNGNKLVNEASPPLKTTPSNNLLFFLKTLKHQQKSI